MRPVLHILVVDDDATVRTLVVRLFRAEGHTVQQAASAADALFQCDQQAPDLVVTDLVMPGESGVELRRSLAKRWPEMPVVLISGFSADAPAEFAARVPHTYFLPKPFLPEHILGLVEDIVSGVAANRGPGWPEPPAATA